MAQGETTRDRFALAISKPGAIQRFLERIEAEAAFLPHYPEMLDFELAENADAEREEIETYHEAIK